MGFLKSVISAQKRANREAFDGIESVRAQIVVLKDRRRAVKSMAVPLSDALAALDRGLDAEIARAVEEFNIASLVRPANRTPYLSMELHARNTLGFVLLAGRENIRSALAEKVEASYEGADGIQAEDRAATFAKIDAEILSLELLDERLVREMEAADLQVLRRSDADPRAVLAHDSELPE